MTGVGCGCSKTAGVRYEVTFSDGTKQQYDTVSQAQQAGGSTGKPYTFKAVPK